jgi:hypothetical protein
MYRSTVIPGPPPVAPLIGPGLGGAVVAGWF